MQPYGGFWIRFLAYIIDSIILQVVSTVLGMFAGLGIGFASLGDGTAIASSLIVVGLSVVISWLYSAVLESSEWQGTVGKKALSLIVTDEFGERIGFGRATGRYFAKIISTMIMLIGFFMIGWTGRKQGLHDMIAGTLVYKSNSPQLVRNSADVFS